MSASRLITPVSEEHWRIRRAFRPGEVAWLLGTTYDVVIAKIGSGELAAQKLGKRWIVPRSEVERLAEAPAKARAAGTGT